jgi:hypothetical protein
LNIDFFPTTWQNAKNQYPKKSPKIYEDHLLNLPAMAEINIRKKSKSPIWPWILGILAIVAIVVWLIVRNNHADTQPNQSGLLLRLQAGAPVALRPKSMTQVPGIVSLKLETFVA